LHVAVALPLMLVFSGADADAPVIETTNASVEALGGNKLRVVLAPQGRPAVVLRPATGAWDWSATSKLSIPVENPGDEALTLLLRIESAPAQLMDGQIAITPHSAGDLSVWLGAPSPRAMGMLAGPSLTAAGLEPNTLPVTATWGSIDPSRITSLRLGMQRPTVVQQLTLGPAQLVPPSETDRNAYDGIVDGFGQYAKGQWPEKVNSVETLRARGSEESEQLARWRAEIPTRDRFGGLSGIRGFRATGFFRTERRDSRWWLVTPEGNPFFSIGMDVVAASGATYAEGREFMFRDLLAGDGELAAHWSERDDRRGLGAQRGRSFDHGRAFDFHTANRERNSAPTGAHAGASKRCCGSRGGASTRSAIGASLSYWQCIAYPTPCRSGPEGEYGTVSSGGDWWGPMADPFDSRFAVAVDKMAQSAAAQYCGDPYLIGYFVGNELAWGQSTPAQPREYYGLAINALAAGPESPAKSAFLASLIDTYREPDRRAQAWGITLPSWDALRTSGFALPQASLENPAMLHDLAAFTRRFAEAYFRTVAEALRRHDPDHLYVGSRFAWQTAEAVEACAHWCDVVSFNRYRRSIADDPDEWARFHALGKPALIGEPLTGRTLDGENGHVGFVTVADLPYDGLVAAAQEANSPCCAICGTASLLAPRQRHSARKTAS
jgi:hypothetical protein